MVGNKNRLYYRAFRPKAQPPQPTAQCNRQEKAVNTLLESPKSAILNKKAAALLLPCRSDSGCWKEHKKKGRSTMFKRERLHSGFFLI
jgi:hypothetical protein